MQAPKAAKTFEMMIENFNGIDLRNAPQKVALNRSPGAPNMIRETVGNNRKRKGYETVLSFTDEPINGFHTYNDITLVHAGKSIYKVNLEGATSEKIYSDANNEYSTSKQLNGKLYFFDGKKALVYDGKDIKSITEGAYVPTLLIARKPSGGGTTLEALNLLTPKRIERFAGDSTAKMYQLSSSNIDSVDEVKELTANGTFNTLVEGTHYTVNKTLGQINFTATHPAPSTGEDNIYITYSKTVEGYTDRINKCRICTLYGLNGQRDRLFISGNPDFPNYDWYCKADDGSYFADTSYSVIGQDGSRIMGYSIINDNLVTHKDKAENDSNVNLRTGSYDSSKGTVFKSTGSYPAIGAISMYGFVNMQNEPLYLTTEHSIHAITGTDILGEKSSQERSYYITTALQKEDLAKAYACYYDSYYALAINGKIYLLDSTQAVVERDRPYSTRQYEAYMLTNIHNVTVLKTIGDTLYFGTSDGKVKRFKEEGKFDTYLDDGETIPCYWETAEIYGTKPELKKTIKHLAVCLNSYVKTGCTVYARIDGIWEKLFDHDNSADYLDFNDIDFSRFTFRTDDTPTIIGGKCKIKKILHVQFRFENNYNEPFSILWAKMKYNLGNDYIK